MNRPVIALLLVVVALVAAVAGWFVGRSAGPVPGPAPALAIDEARPIDSDRGDDPAEPADERPRPGDDSSPPAPGDDAELAPPRRVDGVPALPRGRVLVDDSSRSLATAGDSAGTAGTLDKEAVKKGISAATPKIKECYEKALKVQPELSGRVVVEFHIEGTTDGGGEVTSGEIVDSDVASPFFEACVLKEVAGTSFDAPSGGGVVTVRYPFRFSNDQAP